MPNTQRCAICRRELPPRAENRFHPFCSERCKLIDLGQWLGEAYRIPDRPAGEEELGEEGRRAPGEDDAGTVH